MTIFILPEILGIGTANRMVPQGRDDESVDVRVPVAPEDDNCSVASMAWQSAVEVTNRAWSARSVMPASGVEL